MVESGKLRKEEDPLALQAVSIDNNARAGQGPFLANSLPRGREEKGSGREELPWSENKNKPG